MSKRVAFFVCKGSEDTEVVTPIDILRRSQAIVDIISVENIPTVALSQGTEIVVNLKLADADLSKYNAFIIPGGDITAFENGTAKKVQDFFVANFNRSDLLFASICAGPHVLYTWGLLAGRKVTAYPGVQKGAFDKEYTGQQVTVDKNLITGNGPGAAFEFGRAISAALFSKEAADGVLSSMQVK
ncbi:MAG: DJ-1/PfpI family protein [Elusimicrobiota bacterium]|jgi:4-methyl-5(b-hydroxyethyl)-thiazole monophosphate biosynthesis|nr:DJ-1/PfpI family protein [Elusimicrobiota bacterium]